MVDRAWKDTFSWTAAIGGGMMDTNRLQKMEEESMVVVEEHIEMEMLLRALQVERERKMRLEREVREWEGQLRRKTAVVAERLRGRGRGRGCA